MQSSLQQVRLLSTSSVQTPHRQHPRDSRVRCGAAAATKNATRRAKLGDSDLEVSECCLGTMTWGKQNTEQDAHTQLSYAFDLGINFLDTAEMYPVPPAEDTQGHTDRYIGSWMQSRKRDDIILATKVTGYGNKYILNKRHEGNGAGGNGADDEVTRLTPKQIRDSVDASLRRLKTDYIDLLQIHWPDRYLPLFGQGAYDPEKERDAVPFEEQLQGLDDVIRAGKVRYAGVSNESSYGVMRFVQLAEQTGLPKIVSIQNSYSLLVRGAFEQDLVETCAPSQANIGLLAYSPLAGGSLSGKYADGKGEPGARFNMFPGYMGRFNRSLAREAVAEYINIAKEHGFTPTQLALAWCKARWHVTSTIIGATSMPQLKENVGAFDIDLPEECMDAINKVYQRFRDPATKPLDD